MHDTYRHSGGDWLRSLGEGRWEFRVRGNLTYREDTGLINSSPVVNIPPLIRMQQGCNHTIKIPGNNNSLFSCTASSSTASYIKG